MQIGNLDLKTRFSWLFVLIKMNFLQKWPKEKRNCPVLKFHAWNMGIILIFHYSDISYNTGPHREYQCNASVSVFFLTSTYNAHPYPNTCLSTPRWRYCVPKINTQLSSWAEFHCSPTKSLADANLLEYVDTHSLLTGYLRPWELDIISVEAARHNVVNSWTRSICFCRWVVSGRGLGWGVPMPTTTLHWRSVSVTRLICKFSGSITKGQRKRQELTMRDLKSCGDFPVGVGKNLWQHIGVKRATSRLSDQQFSPCQHLDLHWTLRFLDFGEPFVDLFFQGHTSVAKERRQPAFTVFVYQVQVRFLVDHEEVLALVQNSEAVQRRLVCLDRQQTG